MTDHVAINEAGLERLRRTCDGLAGRDGLRLSDGRTVAGLLLHMAFYDRLCVERWNQYEATGDVDRLPETFQDHLNAAVDALVGRVPTAVAAESALDAATAAVDRIAVLDAAARAFAVDRGWPRLLSRSEHWHEHLDEIDRALG